MIWTSGEVKEFLKSHGFVYKKYDGDDEYWVNKETHAIVLVPQRNQDIVWDTFKWMVQRSKMTSKQWNQWKNNKQ